MGDVPFSFAGAAPGMASKIFPFRFSKSAGNLHFVLYCRTLLTRQGLPLCATEMGLKSPGEGWRDFGVPPGDLHLTDSAKWRL